MKRTILFSLSALALVLSNGWASEAGIPWLGYKDGIALGEKSQIPVMLYFWADPCQPCDLMKSRTLSDPAIADALAGKVVPVKINLMDEFYLAEKYRNYETPVIIFLAPDGKVIEKLRGFVDAEELGRHLRYIGDGYYKTMTFKQYMESYQKKEA